MKQGEVWFGDLGHPSGSRQAGKRPLLIIQNDPLNANARYSFIVVLPLTAKGPKAPSDIQIQPSEVNGLTEISYTVGAQPLVLYKSQLQRRLGRLTEEDLRRAFRGLDLALGRI